MLCPYCGVAFHFNSLHSMPFMKLPKKVKAGGELRDQGMDCDTLHGSYCPNCGGTIVRHSSTSGDANKAVQTFVIPRHRGKKAMAPEIPLPLVEDFHEASAVVDDSPKSSAALCRRLLQRILHEHLTIKKKDLFEEIDEYIATKNPPTELADQLHAVRSVGNFAAHPMVRPRFHLIASSRRPDAEKIVAP